MSNVPLVLLEDTHPCTVSWVVKLPNASAEKVMAFARAQQQKTEELCKFSSVGQYEALYNVTYRREADNQATQWEPHDTQFLHFATRRRCGGYARQDCLIVSGWKLIERYKNRDNWRDRSSASCTVKDALFLGGGYAAARSRPATKSMSAAD